MGGLWNLLFSNARKLGMAEVFWTFPAFAVSAYSWQYSFSQCVVSQVLLDFNPFLSAPETSYHPTF